MQALLIVDIQRDYFPGGANPLVGPEAAARAAQRVLTAFRTAGSPVVHVQHVWDAADATFMRPGTVGVEIHPLVTPEPGEHVIQKESPNAFLDTTLQRTLTDLGIDHLVVAGMMTSMCVDVTVRAAVDLGLAVTVLSDACAAPDLEFQGEKLPGATVHAVFLAALADGYADVVPTDQFIAAGSVAAPNA